jgi:uncharacterized membrane protein/uncharacterized lipoprotein NlpE involved in copper resistance
MKIYLLFFFLLIAFSCRQKSAGDQSENMIDPVETADTNILAHDTSSLPLFTDNTYPIAYQGFFPCKDCEGILQTVLFNKDHTFQEEHVKHGNDKHRQKSYGNWAIKNDQIVLTEAQNHEISFRLINDTLFAINIKNVPIKDSFKYHLVKKELAIENPVWNEKRKNGIDFVGMGNEPFWNIEIRNGKNLHFKLADWKSPVIAPMESINENVDSTVYKFNSNHQKWSVIIYSEFCSDGMSDLLYQYKVKVFYNQETYTGCGIMLNKNGNN